MKPGYVSSDPHFLRPVRAVFLGASAAFLLVAAFVPAPLQDPANLRRVPNPVKAAWFLVWVQELVSYGNALVYPVLALGLGFFVLPYLPGVRPAQRARWFPDDQRGVNGATVAVSVAITVLTIVAMFFRGENWQFGF